MWSTTCQSQGSLTLTAAAQADQPPPEPTARVNAGFGVFSTEVISSDAMPSVRRLAAILAADVAGYSRLMGADEEGTHERLKAHLGELVNPKITQHRGRIVKNTGDGFLAEFASVVDAIRCATEIQRRMVDHEPEVPEERRIRFRIGINLGDVIAEEHDIFGDGVNVAARLEGLAEPGGICVSRVVRDQVRDKLDYAFEDQGDQEVKNIARPVRVYVWRPEGSEALKRKEGLQQILKFLFDHPEIEYVTTEHFAKDDPAYELVEEEPDHFPPIDRSIAAGRLAGEEALLKAASAALSAINRVEELFKDPFEGHELIEDDAKLAG